MSKQVPLCVREREREGEGSSLAQGIEESRFWIQGFGFVSGVPMFLHFHMDGLRRSSNLAVRFPTYYMPFS